LKDVIQNIQVFRKYFSAEITIKDVEDYFKIYNENYIDFENHFYSVLINSNDEIFDEVLKLLFQLNINVKLWGSYFSQDLSIYNFFKELSKDHENSTQLNDLINLIVKRKWYGLGELLQSLAIAALFISPILAAILYPAFLFMYDFLFKTANFLPILGIIISFSTLIVNIFLNHLNDRRHSFKIYRDDIFLVVSSVLGIAAKITLIIAKSVLAPIAAFLFIAAALVDTLKELFYLLELRKNYLKKPDFGENNQAIIHQQYARHEYDYLKQRNALIINLIAALTLTALVITCSFFPVGIILTISTCASIACVYLLKTLFLTLNENSISHNLQTELKYIGERYETTEFNEDSYNQLRESLHIDNDFVPQIETQKQTDVVRSGHYQTVRSGPQFFKSSLTLTQKQRTTVKKDMDDTQETSYKFG